MRNYAGHRLSPWLGHLMVSRQETARPLLTPGEVMQLPADDELVLVSGCAPIRGKKVRYFTDRELKRRILKAPNPSALPFVAADAAGVAEAAWSSRMTSGASTTTSSDLADDDGGGLRREPELETPDLIVDAPALETLDWLESDDEDPTADLRHALDARVRRVARQAALDPDDGIEL